MYFRNRHHTDFHCQVWSVSGRKSHATDSLDVTSVISICPTKELLYSRPLIDNSLSLKPLISGSMLGTKVESALHHSHVCQLVIPKQDLKSCRFRR